MNAGKRNRRQDHKVNRVQSTLGLVGYIKDNIKVSMFRSNVTSNAFEQLNQ